MSYLDNYLEELQHPLDESPAAIGLIYVGMVVTLFLAVVSKIAIAAAKRYLTEAGRKCARYKGETKQKCIAKVKKESYKKQIEVFQKYKSQCSKTKNPDDCKKKMDKKIESLKKKHDNIVLM